MISLSAQGPKTAAAVKQAIEKAKTSDNRLLDSMSNRVAINLIDAEVHEGVSTWDVGSAGFRPALKRQEGWNGNS